MTRHNVCTNPSCTANVTGWGGASTPTRQTGLSGFPVTTGARYSSGSFMQTQTGAASPGLAYTGSMYVRPNGANASGGTLFLVFQRSSGGDDFSHTVSLGTLTNNVVTRISLANVTAPANTTGIYLLVDGIGLNLGGAGNVDFSAVLLEQAAAVDTFFDGDSAGGSWDGTAGNSASTLADAGANPNGLAVALGLGQPTVAIPTAAPAGLAATVALGQPSAAIPAAAPAGLGLAAALGTPTVALGRTAAPAGLGLGILLGQPTVGLPGAAPNGVALPASVGQPAAAYTLAVTPSGVAVPVALGNPSAGSLPEAPADVRPRLVTSGRPARITTSGRTGRLETSGGGQR